MYVKSRACRRLSCEGLCLTGEGRQVVQNGQPGGECDDGEGFPREERECPTHCGSHSSGTAGALHTGA